ncbi:hypothetical protein [Methanococcus maripaludis]|uniref:Uncharacterized protein n=1 Tax=Methanococcus maripaludis TaxID=39152 RepID=A0A7J9S7C3_METMI|nr:hypothetical protein [Methanococcus maripaludis]MBB6495987.1 hypothetical protein [Methanococcus maripaludis]
MNGTTSLKKLLKKVVTGFIITLTVSSSLGISGNASGAEDCLN